MPAPRDRGHVVGMGSEHLAQTPHQPRRGRRGRSPTPPSQWRSTLTCSTLGQRAQTRDGQRLAIAQPLKRASRRCVQQACASASVVRRPRERGGGARPALARSRGHTSRAQIRAVEARIAVHRILEPLRSAAPCRADADRAGATSRSGRKCQPPRKGPAHRHRGQPLEPCARAAAAAAKSPPGPARDAQSAGTRPAARLSAKAR